MLPIDPVNAPSRRLETSSSSGSSYALMNVAETLALQRLMMNTLSIFATSALDLSYFEVALDRERGVLIRHTSKEDRHQYFLFLIKRLGLKSPFVRKCHSYKRVNGVRIDKG